VGKTVSTDEVAERLADLSTVTPGDTYAVLKNLGGVLADYMAEGRTVKLDGVGTFYYTAVATHQGVNTPEEVKATHITGVRVRFLPEASRTASNKVAARSLIADHIIWVEWGGKTHGGSEAEPEEPEEPTPPPPSGPVED
jgi:predicted histone-like DNA-binding protein